MTAINKDYECCTFRGGIVAMNKFTGETKWKYHTVNEPIETGFNDADTKKWGPSGVPVWSSPTIDIKEEEYILALVKTILLLLQI